MRFVHPGDRSRERPPTQSRPGARQRRPWGSALREVPSVSRVGRGVAADPRVPRPLPRHSATRGARRGTAGRRGHSVLAVRTAQRLKTLTPARLTQSHEAELRTLATGDRLLLDDVGLEAMDAQERRRRQRALP